MPNGRDALVASARLWNADASHPPLPPSNTMPNGRDALVASARLWSADASHPPLPPSSTMPSGRDALVASARLWNADAPHPPLPPSNTMPQREGRACRVRPSLERRCSTSAPRTQPSLKCHNATKNLKLLLDWGGVRYCRIHALLLMALCGEVDDV